MIRRLFDIFGRHGSAGASAGPSMRFVDLGLPSGTLWAERDVEESSMAGCSLPTYEQAYYGIPKGLYDKGLEYLTPHFKNVVKEFEDKYGNKVLV